MHRNPSAAAASTLLLTITVLANLAAAQTPQQTAADRKAKQAAEDRFVPMLEKPFTAKFDQVPLEDALASIRRLTGLPIRIDTEALDDASIGVDTPVTFSVPGVSLRAALRQMLEQSDLTWVIRDGAMLVTTAEKASELVEVKVYPVQDLAAAANPADPRAGDYQPLIQAITKAIGEFAWEDAGGPGAIGQFSAPGSLVISQTFAAHEKIALLLAAMRKARDRQQADPDALLQPAPAALPAHAAFTAQTDAGQAAEDRIRVILEKPYSAKFAKTPLSAALAEITRTTGLPIQIDRQALENASIAPDTPLTCELPTVSLRSALSVIVRQLDLAWTVDNECVLVTNSAVTDNLLITKVYPVSDLIGAVKAGNPPVPNYHAIAQVMTDSIAPTSWGEVGGAGEISPFVPSCCLVVSQTFAAHEEIALLLSALRKARDVQHIAADGPDNPPGGFRGLDLADPKKPTEPGQPIVPGAGGGVF
jgi:hypothetical protein